MITKQDKYIAGIYCRLSSDDGQSGESGSISTQKTLLTQFCKERGFTIHDCYIDDGWSGTNFDRPSFKRMLTDIEEGKINLVVVKDLSRFGREYAQMGLYIEHHFEENDVRFIAVPKEAYSHPRRGMDYGGEHAPSDYRQRRMGNGAENHGDPPTRVFQR